MRTHPGPEHRPNVHKQTKSTDSDNRSGYVIGSPIGIHNSTDGCIDSSAEGALAGTSPASQHGLCAALPPLHPRESLWMEVRVALSLLWRFRLTFVPAVQIPSRIRKQTKTKDGFWRMVPLLVTGSVDTGQPPAVLDPGYLTHLIIVRILQLSELPLHLVVTSVKSPFAESESRRGAMHLHSVPST